MRLLSDPCNNAPDGDLRCDLQSVSGDGRKQLATVHFWLHQAGALSLLTLFYLVFGTSVEESKYIPFIFVSEIGLFGGTLVFAWNAVRNAH